MNSSLQIKLREIEQLVPSHTDMEQELGLRLLDFKFCLSLMPKSRANPPAPRWPSFCEERGLERREQVFE